MAKAAQPKSKEAKAKAATSGGKGKKKVSARAGREGALLLGRADSRAIASRDRSPRATRARCVRAW